MGLLGFGRKAQLRRLACRATGMDCAAVITVKTDEEVLMQAAEHGQKAHQKAHRMKPSAEMAAQLRKLIKSA